MPGVSTPALGLPYPSLRLKPALGKTLVVYGSSTSTGLIVTQIATAAGIYVIAITGAKDFELSNRCGAGSVIDHKDLDVVGKVVEAVRNSRHEFVGIFDAISRRTTM
jgi:NADPH:quinone reductase-like Zn-dependent oxidoreductase